MAVKAKFMLIIFYHNRNTYVEFLLPTLAYKDQFTFSCLTTKQPNKMRERERERDRQRDRERRQQYWDLGRRQHRTGILEREEETSNSHDHWIIAVTASRSSDKERPQQSPGGCNCMKELSRTPYKFGSALISTFMRGTYLKPARER
jgi:hypothetical protein